MSHNDKPVYIAETGVCTPVGINTIMMSTGVAVKDAGFQEASVLDLSGEPVRASMLSFIDKDADRTQRICFLAESAVEEVMFNAQLPENLEALEVFIGLPELDETIDCEQIKQTIQKASEIKLKISDNNIFSTGRSGFFHALDAAKKSLNSGKIDYALVGSVDSMCDPFSLRKLIDSNKKLGDSNTNGLIPGEGAGFFIITNKQNSTQVLCISLSNEPKPVDSSEPSNFEGLTKAIYQLMKHPLSEGKNTDLVLTSQTGEDYWNREFATAYLRNATIMPEPLISESIAESHGDAGSGSGSIMFADAITRKIKPESQNDYSGRVLLYSSSNNGSIGSCIVDNLNQNARPEWFESCLIRNHPDRDEFFVEHFYNHFEEIGWLISSRHRELHELKIPWTDFPKVEQRLFRHLKAMVIAGSIAREFAYQQLEEIDNDVVSGAVYTIASLAEDIAERDNLLKYFSKAEPEMINVWTLTLKHSQNLYLDELPEKLISDLSTEHEIALTEVMAYQGAGDKDFLISQISKENQEARNFAATALSRMNVNETKNILNNIPETQFSMEIYLALIFLDDQNILEKCRSAIQDQNNESTGLPLVIALAGNENDGDLLMDIDDGETKSQALGISGLGKFIPILIENLKSEDPEVKKHSAESIERITSAGFLDTIADPDFDPEIDDKPETTIEISKDYETWNNWWEENNKSFEPDKRYRNGQPFSLLICLKEIENPITPYRIRKLAALELSIRSGKNFKFQPDAFEEIQLIAIEGWKKGV